jgi:hypothetical protein
VPVDVEQAGRIVIPHRVEVLILVKAAPVLTKHLDETMCVAGLRLDEGEPSWIRLHPVPFRDLEDERKFAKYQRLSVEVRPPKSDRRPESWTPLPGTIQLSETIGTESAWAQRRAVIDRLQEVTMCDLVAANRLGSGEGTQSLAVVRPIDVPRLLISERDEEQLTRWRSRAKAASSRMSLFDDPSSTPRPPFDVVPWRFRYEYRCAATGCSGHKQTIVDWEVLALWRHVRHHEDWREKMRRKFEEDLWSGRDSVLFVGNQEQHPTSFLVLGVFWPPAGPSQQVLGL